MEASDISNSSFTLGKPPRCISFKYSKFLVAWKIFTLILAILDLIQAPLQFALSLCTEYYELFIFLDAFITTFFIIDLGVNFRTAYLLLDGEFQVKPCAIACYYLKTGFLIDLICAFPFHRIELNHVKILSLIRMLRLLRIK